MISLPYGNKSINFNIQGENLTVFRPEEIRPTVDQENIVKNALNSILEPLSDSMSKKKMKIAIGINDQSRPIPHNILLPCLLDYLEINGFDLKNIIFFIATGTHAPLKPTEFSLILDQDIISIYQVVSHDCDVEANLIFLGNTAAGTPVHVNRQFMESDVKILVGNIESHHFMGFSGGVKTAAIGLTSRKTITANHSMLSHPNTTMGLFSSNPMRVDVEEIGKMIGIDYVLNVVLNDDKEIIKAYWGDPIDVMSKGIEFIRSNLQMDLDISTPNFDLVIASAGGYPKDINFYQAQKAITHACLFSKPGGVIILAAECKDGMGSKKFEEFLGSKTSFPEVIKAFEAMQFEIGPHKAYQLAKQAIMHKIILISEMEEDLVRKMHLLPSKSFKQAYDLAREALPENSKIAILPYATHTMPKIAEVN
jgi:nickel-dependent lactate racemase